MSERELNRRLTSLDATFLYLEKKECPMHLGSTSIFEGKLSVAKLKKHIKERLHLIPRYTQKVVPDPFNIAHPTWEFDEEFDINKHIFHIKSRKKVTYDELRRLAGERMTVLMNRDKPLWELYVIDNLDDGNSAMIAKIHHCMVDGISGVDLMKILFDITPEGEPPPQPRKHSNGKRKMDQTRAFLDSVLGSMQEGMNRFTELQAGLLYMASSFADPKMVEKLPAMAEMLPAATTPAPILPFNGKCSGERKLAWSEVSFADARFIKNVLGGSVNDVVLTILSEAVARYTRENGAETKGQIVRFMMPVSLRQNKQRGSLGNLISIIPVEIPLEVLGFSDRFNYVNQKTALMKETKLAAGLLTVGAAYALLPAPLQSVLGHIADLPFPPFNLVATNVPGPQIPLFLVGRKMLKQYPYVPVGYGLGLGCAILSYDKSLFFGLSSDAAAMPDVERFNEILDETFQELLEFAKNFEAGATEAAVI
ncbi:MAG: wax ester/triacylglycerol synthase family O-acyltransferase [Pyrinomonadaceae bacterium]